MEMLPMWKRNSVTNKIDKIAFHVFVSSLMFDLSVYWSGVSDISLLKSFAEQEKKSQEKPSHIKNVLYFWYIQHFSWVKFTQHSHE